VSPAKSPAGQVEGSGQLKVTQVRSAISTKPKHRGTLRALGLRGVGRSRILPDRPDVRGMLARVPHLVLVAPAGEDEAARQKDKSAAARDARRARRSPGETGEDRRAEESSPPAARAAEPPASNERVSRARPAKKPTSEARPAKAATSRARPAASGAEDAEEESS
jgi:large subunit ribosomal protein L30